MALSKLEFDKERVEELMFRMKFLIELTGLRDPSLNEKETKEIRAIRKELEEMGLYVTIKYRPQIDFANPLESTLEVDIDILIPKNVTIQ
ncbi:MAG: hypothetical protein UT29_C0001G0135 [Candidatus Yanofskybacteria bacterium GW2011_GWA1_39_13]|uniref:Uncharacterized protein n=1 Tax=Yanofskybacteria sp. (strain GW2011_GWA1_39_13) TaxID=1619019 RepID=A0A0G0PWY3_YANXG|nr:MAG: hypothetical protein UT29_C0001G0135 [Candidatus Yanofskybacteria bacterium GW2011_GWA1_39_13]